MGKLTLKLFCPAGMFCLTLKRTQLTPHLTRNITCAQQVSIHRRETLFRSPTTLAVLGDIRCLFNKQTTLFGATDQNGVQTPLTDNGMSIFSKP